jgi:hypothetical protein
MNDNYDVSTIIARNWAIMLTCWAFTCVMGYIFIY